MSVNLVRLVRIGNFLFAAPAKLSGFSRIISCTALGFCLMCDGMNPTTNLLDGGKNYRDPSISPEGTRDTAPLDAEVAATSNW